MTYIVVVLNTESLLGGPPGTSGQLFGVGKLITEATPDIMTVIAVCLSQSDAQAIVDALNAV